MNIPKIVNICGQEFKIVYKNKMLDEEDCELFGYCYTENCVIYLQKNLNDAKLKEVFLHECIHAIDENLNLDLGEEKVNLLGIHILSLITNNKLNFNTRKRK